MPLEYSDDATRTPSTSAAICPNIRPQVRNDPTDSPPAPPSASSGVTAKAMSAVSPTLTTTSVVSVHSVERTVRSFVCSAATRRRNVTPAPLGVARRAGMSVGRSTCADGVSVLVAGATAVVWAAGVTVLISGHTPAGTRGLESDWPAAGWLSDVVLESWVATAAAWYST